MSGEKPWYHDGLRFECTGCGNCCTGAPGVVWVSQDELEQIAEFLGTSAGEVRLMQTRLVGNRLSLREYANGDCVFFDPETRKCNIYSVRPVQCQTWPFWKSNLESPKTWRETQKSCPGAGTGDFVSIEVIEQWASAIDI